jgi:hypothetical protein
MDANTPITSSVLQTDQHLPRPGSQSGTVEADLNPLQPFFDKTWQSSEIEPI